LFIVVMVHDQDIGYEERASREADGSATTVSDTAGKWYSKRQWPVEAPVSQHPNSVQAVRPKKKSKTPVHPEAQDTFDNNVTEDTGYAPACPVEKWARKEVTSVQP
jgi:hypothetical protein